MGLNIFIFTGHRITFQDGSQLKVEFKPLSNSVTVVDGSIVDCNGNEYGTLNEDWEMDEGFQFATEKSMQQWFNYRGLQNEWSWTTPYIWYYCWTPAPGTVQCQERTSWR